MNDYDGLVAVVTGGASSIGAAPALLLRTLPWRWLSCPQVSQ